MSLRRVIQSWSWYRDVMSWYQANPGAPHPSILKAGMDTALAANERLRAERDSAHAEVDALKAEAAAFTAKFGGESHG